MTFLFGKLAFLVLRPSNLLLILALAGLAAGRAERALRAVRSSATAVLLHGRRARCCRWACG